MARDRRNTFLADRVWDRLRELFEAGSPEFVDAIRQVMDAKALAPFAETWYTDPRIEARKLLNLYLARPLNSPRHEPLVKRLFKFADNAGDDATMARFLVALDRSVRRRAKTRRRWDYQAREYVEERTVNTPGDTALPRDDRYYTGHWYEQNRDRLTDGKFLFSVATRGYLRRRAWRYFRRLGRQAPERYIPAVSVALKQYTDADIPDGLSLLDNWGLVHVLFHHSPTIVAKPAGWRVAPGGSLGSLRPDPMFRRLWQRSPEPLMDLLTGAKCRPVRQWAIQMLRRHFPDRLAKVTLDELLAWLESSVPELNDLAAELIDKVTGLEAVPVERWLKLVEAAGPDVLDRLTGLIARVVRPEQVGFADAVKLAMARPVPLARLGQAMLTPKRPKDEAEIKAIFGLRDAEAEPLRPALVKWACEVLGALPNFQPTWVLEFLDSRHADVREAGWVWLQTDERARESAVVWQRLLESPYDDVRLRLVALLDERAKDPAGLDAFSPTAVRFLWASVLLNIHRGGRAKPFAVRQVIDRLGRKPEEAEDLLPIVGVALRSVRGPEFRAGLAGVAGFVAKHPQHRGLVEQKFPELQLN
ncbi:MAG: hypothetical protein K2X82_33375 [Gemmataceae bacterium]|nr:hypothetical protein [Gemmataceae bacterium]